VPPRKDSTQPPAASTVAANILTNAVLLQNSSSTTTKRLSLAVHSKVGDAWQANFFLRRPRLAEQSKTPRLRERIEGIYRRVAKAASRTYLYSISPRSCKLPRLTSRPDHEMAPVRRPRCHQQNPPRQTEATPQKNQARAHQSPQAQAHPSQANGGKQNKIQIEMPAWRKIHRQIS
jgi:hypothetical protein